MAGFLGINMDQGTQVKVIITQIGLIDRILSVTYMEDCNHKYTSIEKLPLGKDENWEYRSIVGMLLYLAGSSRPYFAYTVHQCARFAHNPKESHEVGVKHIIRYMKGTKGKGSILSPDTATPQLDLYVDADFDGLFTAEDVQNPISVKS